MNHKVPQSKAMAARPPRPVNAPPRRALQLGALVAATSMCASSHALDFGPDGMFSLTGFAEISVTRGTNQCPGCQFDPDTDRQRNWTDAVVPGRAIITKDTVFTQIQPYLGVKYDLGQGFKFNGVISQRWRDGSRDLKHFVYEENIAISHEDYGRLAIGKMTSRTWNLADYPYATKLALASTWAGSGAGYRYMTQALRYTSRIFDVAEGDLVLEATYDRGNVDFKIHKPRFVELWAHYGYGDLTLDATLQDARNGGPVAWGLAPFRGVAYNRKDDADVGGSSQGMVMLLARYQLNSRIEIDAGVRRNRWSGADAAIIEAVGPQWNNMFNVDWGGTRNGVANPGYSARSTDWSAGVVYRMDKWSAATGVAYLGKASTANPSERGQSNSLLVNTARVSYDYGSGVEFYVTGGMVHYGRKGLSPLSLPSNATIEKIDSRVTKNGNWISIGTTYAF